MKWFLDVDGGTGQNPLDYRYPVGNVVGGNQFMIKWVLIILGIWHLERKLVL